MDRPRLHARLTGLFALLTIAGGIFAQGFVSEKLIDYRDAAATAGNVLAHRGLYELGFTVYMLEMACQIVTSVLFYRLLRPVNGTVALASMALGLSGCVIKAFARVFYLAPLFVLGGVGAHAPGGLTGEQLQALSLVLLKVNDRAAGVALAFFGFETLLQGVLVIRSTFLPRWLGVLVVVASVGWLSFLSPTLGYRVFIPVALFALVASAAMIGWLLIKGVDEERWRLMAARPTRQSPSGP